MHSNPKLAKEFKISFPEKMGCLGGCSLNPLWDGIKTLKCRQAKTSLHSNKLPKTILTIDLKKQNYIKTNNLDNVCPRRIFNCNETAFFLNSKLKKVFIEKRSKNIYITAGAGAKFSIIVLLRDNAATELAPPMVIYR